MLDSALSRVADRRTNMAIDERTLEVIQSFYDSAMDETRWGSALEALLGFTGSQAATFWVLKASPGPELATFRFLNFDPAGMQYYLDHMAGIDPTNQYLVTHPDEPIVHDGLVISDWDKDRNAYYDWHLGLDDTRYRMVGQVHPAPGTQAGVAMHRRRKVGRYESNDIERFAFVHRHLAQALAIGFRLGTLGTMQKCTAELLDRSPAAILLLDDRGRIVLLNRSAQALEADGDGIQFIKDGIVLQRKQDNDRLQALITQACTAAPAGQAMRAARPSGKRAYAILVGPVSARDSALSAVQPAVCVVITDPDRATPYLKQRLRAVYGLTEAEARLAVLLAAGQKLRGAATSLGITYATSRTRLTAIFEKTDARTQHELVALLMKTLTA